MEKEQFAENTLDLLCEYAGDEAVLLALINRWGIESVFDVVSKLYESQQEESDE